MKKYYEVWEVLQKDFITYEIQFAWSFDDRAEAEAHAAWLKLHSENQALMNCIVREIEWAE